MRIKYDNLGIDVEIIGGFRINEKEYAVCLYDDSDKNSKIVIVELIKENGDVHVKDIPEDEIDFVLSQYEKIEKAIMEVK